MIYNVGDKVKITQHLNVVTKTPCNFTKLIPIGETGTINKVYPNWWNKGDYAYSISEDDTYVYCEEELELIKKDNKIKISIF